MEREEGVVALQLAAEQRLVQFKEDSVMSQLKSYAQTLEDDEW